MTKATAEDLEKVGCEIADRLAASWRSKSMTWRGAGLGANSGLALLFGELAMSSIGSSEEWAQLCYEQFVAATEQPLQSPGLFTGMSGLRFAALELKPVLGDACDEIIDSLGRHLREHVDETLHVFTPPKSSPEFDLISGYCGMAVGLGQGEPGAVSRIEEYLGWLASDFMARLRTPLYGSEQRGEGWLNLGTAHGIASLLVAIARSNMNPEVGRALAELIVSVESNGYCPSAVRDLERAPARQGWCYGTPGTMASLAAYAKKLGDPDLTESAKDAMTSMYQRPRETWHIEDFAICHGLSGVALAFQAAGDLLGDRELTEMAHRCAMEISDAFDSNLTWGYRAIRDDGSRAEDPSFLTGSTGIALSLLTLAGAIRKTWLKGIALG